MARKQSKNKTQKQKSPAAKSTAKKLNARGPKASTKPKNLKLSRPKKKGSVKRVSLSTKLGKGLRAAKSALGILPENDLVTLLLEDHKRLKELIETMKDSELDMEEREAAFDEFAPALLAHAKPEEQTLYASMKSSGEMREDGYEGDVEHGLADQMVEEIKRTDDRDLRSAKLKVLAELVSHHIKEEEEDMLPKYRKTVDNDARVKYGEQFLSLKAELQSEGADDAPPEAILIAEEKTRKASL